MSENKPSENADAPNQASAPDSDQASSARDEHPEPDEHQEVVEAPEPEATADGDQGDAESAEQMAALKDQLLRSAAEVENIRRRAARDVEKAHKFALERFTNELLPVVDSLEKAIEAAGNIDTEAARALTEGVELSLKLFVGVLEKSGVAQIDPLGEPFDPQLHEAMAMVPNPDAEPNSVMEVMQKGYSLNGRLVRAAKVVVASGAS